MTPAAEIALRTTDSDKGSSMILTAYQYITKLEAQRALEAEWDKRSSLTPDDQSALAGKLSDAQMEALDAWDNLLDECDRAHTYAREVYHFALGLYSSFQTREAARRETLAAEEPAA